MGTPRTPGTPKAGGTDGGGGEGRSASTRSARAQSMYAAVSEEEAPPPSTFEEEALASLHGLEAALGRLLVVLPRKALNQLRVSQGASATTNHAAAASAGRMAPEPPRPSTAPLLPLPAASPPQWSPNVRVRLDDDGAVVCAASASAASFPAATTLLDDDDDDGGGVAGDGLSFNDPEDDELTFNRFSQWKVSTRWRLELGHAPNPPHLRATTSPLPTGEPDRPRQARRARLRARAEAPGRRRRRGVGERARARRRAAQGVDDARAEGAEGIQAVKKTIVVTTSIRLATRGSCTSRRAARG